jgi:MFS family permease
MIMNKQEIVLGFRANWRQFILLAVINAFVGAMVGLERTIVPLIAQADFGLASKAIILSFIVTFGVVKALTNLFAGRLGDRLGRKRILVAGWLIGLPVPLILIFAPGWGWIVFANVLLGINQGLCWSQTVVMKVDLLGPKQRGLATGVNEFAGYIAVAISAFLTGYLAASYGLRPMPFYPGVAFALIGLALSVLFVRETQLHARYEAQTAGLSSPGPQAGGENRASLSFAEILLLASWKDRALFAASQAGLVTNLKDGMMWGLMALFLAGAGLPLAQIGVVVAAYPAVWGIGQLATGILSDRWGRKWMIAGGMWVQAAGLVVFVLGHGFGVWLAGAALVYPTLLAAVSDVAHPEWRATALGVYRLWRDGGYAVGALLSGVLADAFGIPIAIAAIGALTFLSGVIVAGVMYETLASRRVTASIQEPVHTYSTSD